MLKTFDDVIAHLEGINDPDNERLEYLLHCVGDLSRTWYETILAEVIKTGCKRVVDIGSNVNQYGYLFANAGIEYIGIDRDLDGLLPVETDMIRSVSADYYDVREQFANDVVISCLCVGYMIPETDVLAARLITNKTVS